MANPFKRKPKPYDDERQHIMLNMSITDPSSDQYHTLMSRLDELDQIRNRTTELKKTVIPAAGTVLGVGGIYLVQQFAGIIVPKALENIRTRSDQSNNGS